MLISYLFVIKNASTFRNTIKVKIGQHKKKNVGKLFLFIYQNCLLSVA